jgi:uncharacterized membrane protein YfcA
MTPDMEWYIYAALFAAGLIAGFINTLAGSGSLITLPLLIFAGLPANVANATNRISVFLQSAVSTVSFRNQKVYEIREGLWLGIPAVLGSLIGAIAAIQINARMMEILIGALLVFMFFIVLYKPEKWIQSKAGSISRRPKLFQIIIFFLIGAYGGFLQAGVGFMLLGGLVLGSGLNLTKANGLKAFIILILTAVALIVFISNKQIAYLPGFVLAAGSMAGAYFASKYAVSWGPKVVRIFLLAALLGSALKFTGSIDLVIRLLK